MSNEKEAGSGSSYDAEQDVHQRLLLATPEHTTRGFLFTSTLRTVRELGGDEEMVRRCLAATGEREFLDFFNYPTRSLLQLLEAAARVLRPRYGSFEEALRQIGRRSGESYMASAVGRSAHLMTAGDPKQLVNTLQAVYKVLMSYAEPSVISKGPRSGLLIIRRTFTPVPYHEGGSAAISEKLGGRNVKVRGRMTGPLSIELDITWE